MQPTFLQVQKRLKFLIGEDGSTGADSTITGSTQISHINAAIKDILNSVKFSWNIKASSLTLASGTASLPSDFNPRWGLEDARIVNSSTGDDNIFTNIPIPSRDNGATEYMYWITYDTSTDLYIFNTPLQTGTVTIFYNFLPADLVLTTDDAEIVPIPDLEAVAYTAAAKHWISDERNEEMAKRFDSEGKQRVQALYIQDINYGPQYTLGTPASLEAVGRGNQ